MKKKIQLPDYSPLLTTNWQHTPGLEVCEIAKKAFNFPNTLPLQLVAKVLCVETCVQLAYPKCVNKDRANIAKLIGRRDYEISDDSCDTDSLGVLYIRTGGSFSVL